MKLLIGALLPVAYLLGGSMAEASLLEQHGRPHKRSILAFLNEDLYREMIRFPVDRWEREYEAKNKRHLICVSEDFAQKPIEWLDEMIMNNCTIPTEAIMDRVLLIERVLNEIESRPKKQFLSAFLGGSRTKYNLIKQWFFYWAARVTDKETKEVASTLETLIGRSLHDNLTVLTEVIEKIQVQPGVISSKDFTSGHRFFGVCILDHYLVTNDNEHLQTSRFLEQLKKDARSAARYASYCNESVTEKAYDEKAQRIIRKIDTWFDANWSLLWSKLIRREADKVFPQGKIDERNYTQLASDLSARLATLDPQGLQYGVLVFPSSYDGPKWMSMVPVIDPIDQKNSSVLLHDLHGVNMFIGRFRYERKLRARLSWTNALQDKTQEILRMHSDEDASVLMDRVRKEIPNLLDPKHHFSSAILLRNQRLLFFLNSTIPHAWDGSIDSGPPPYVSAYIKSNGLTSTQVYLYLFP